MDGIEFFDAKFFGVSAMEAMTFFFFVCGVPHQHAAIVIAVL